MLKAKNHKNNPLECLGPPIDSCVVGPAIISVYPNGIVTSVKNPGSNELWDSTHQARSALWIKNRFPTLTRWYALSVLGVTPQVALKDLTTKTHLPEPEVFRGCLTLVVYNTVGSVFASWLIGMFQRSNPEKIPRTFILPTVPAAVQQIEELMEADGFRWGLPNER